MTTGTDPLDELEVPHFKERLWHELAELRAEHRRPQSPGRDTSSDVVRRKARRSLRIAGIGAAAAVLVIVGVFTAQMVGTGTDRPTGHGPDAVSMQRIAAATDEALAESVVHTVNRKVAPDGERSTSEWWHDETTGIARMLDRDGQGNPLMDVGPLTGPTIDSAAYSGQRLVDYCSQQYIEHVDTGGAETNIGAGVVDLGDLIADGELVEDGTEVVDGRQLIRLRGTDSEGGDHVLLVDPNTYRVVGLRGTLSTGETQDSVYEYLPRTAEHLDLLQPPIPTGFTQVDPSTPGFTYHTEPCTGP